MIDTRPSTRRVAIGEQHGGPRAGEVWDVENFRPHWVNSALPTTDASITGNIDEFPDGSQQAEKFAHERAINAFALDCACAYV